MTTQLISIYGTGTKILAKDLSFLEQLVIGTEKIPALLDKASLLAVKNQYFLADKLYKTLLKMHPLNQDIWVAFAGYNLRQNKIQQVELLADEARVFFKSNPVFHREFGFLLFQCRKYQKAAAFLETAINLGDGEGNLFILARCYEKLGDLAKAAQLYSNCIDGGSNKQEAFKNRGKIYFKEERYKECITDFVNYMELNGDDPEVKYMLAKAYQNTGRYEESMTIMEDNKDDPVFAGMAVESRPQAVIKIDYLEPPELRILNDDNIYEEQ
ncbi:MAG: tetratricopeptide repeat protein [Bacillota bacterium]